MSNSRRKFIKNSVLLSASIPLLSSSLLSCSSIDKNKLSILILGGTSFLGPHQIKYALERGHKVSIFTRGKTKPNVNKEVFDKVEHLIGDRENNLSALENKKWDIVIDNSGKKAKWTQKTAQLLKDNCGVYVYTSSTGVYFPYKTADIKEDQKVLLKEPEVIEDEMLKMEYWYGVMKANSEQETIKAFGKERSIIVRPTYMFGPGDKTDRFMHWPVRLAKGGEILVPGKTDDPVQYIDVRDVAEFTIRLAEQKSAGTYNVVGPSDKETMLDFVTKTQHTFNAESTIVQIDDYDFLKKHNVLSLVPWIPVDEYNYGSARVSNTLAIKNGLTFRDTKTSIKETHNWWYSDNLTDERRAKFEQKEDSVLVKEKEIIADWKNISKL
ncbi:NAD-dependent epimerase/dehydratase family protein [Polaribacter marinaquae]|uniref:NAD-dependent epimerase/dehydratase family protein n=1 Tax=Polaribacter marinaquae TaxID=1642819 RepID=A0ABZ2TVV9_9FLAO